MIRLLHPKVVTLLMCCLFLAISLQADTHPIPCLDDWEEGAFPPKSMASMTVNCPLPIIVNLPDDGCTINIDIPEPTSNCEIISITNDFNGMASIPPQDFNATTFEITWTVVDCDGEFTCTQTIIIQDGTAPTFVCPSSTIEQCSAADMVPFETIDELLAAGAIIMDNCALDSTYLLAGEPILVDAGPCPTTFERTYTVRDTSGNEAMCMQTIIVNDTVNPVFTCPVNITVSTTLGTCTADITVPSIDVTDNCGAVTITNTLAANAGDIVNLPLGDTSVKYYAEDLCGNIDSCETIITVIDETPPSMTCADNLSAECDASEVALFVDYNAFVAGGGIASDICGTIDESSFAFVSESSDMNICPETITRTYTIADDSGNFATCEHLVVVSEVEPPTFTVPIDTVVNCGVTISDTMNLGAPTEVMDNCASSNVTLSYTDAVNANVACPVLLTVSRSWVATDACGNTSDPQVQTIMVQDTTAPIAVCKMDTLYLDESGDVTFDVQSIDGGSFDACGAGALTLTSNFEFASCNDATLMQDIILTVTDICGNSSTCMTSILVLDTLPVTLTCPPNINVDCPISVPLSYATYVEFDNAGGDFSDNCSNDLPTSFSLMSETVSGTTCPYDIIRTYVAADVNGNSDTCAQTITVTDEIDPIVFCPADIMITGTMNTCDTLLNIPLATATDDCGIQSITNDFNGGGDNASGTFSGGVTIITFTATDNCGNVGTCAMTVTVDVNPAFECPSDTTVECDLAEEPIFTTFAQFMDAGGSANMGCGADTSAFMFVNDLLISSNDCTQIYERIYGLPGVMGEMFECSYIITVTDEIAPEISCSGDINVNATLDECTAIVNLMANATDNCDDLVVTNDYSTGTTGEFPIGTTVVTFTATDDCDNTAICTINVTVNDAQAPAITCPEGVLAMCDASSVPVYSFYQQFIDADIQSDISDNCTVDTSSFLYQGEMELTMFGMTFVNRTYSIQDSVGNSSSCTQTILVMDSTAPFVDCPNDITVSADTDECFATVSNLIATTGDNCAVDTTYNSKTGDGLDASGEFTVGVTVVTFTVEDEEGNTDECTMTVTVIDEVLPVLTCPAALAATECSIDDNTAYMSYQAFEEAGGMATDICGIDTSTFTLVSDELLTINDCTAVYQRTYSIQDNGGNVGTCTQEYSITDTTPPTIVCPANITLGTDEGVCSANTTVTVTASDLCTTGTLTITNDHDDSENGIVQDDFLLGETVIVFTTTDDCNLSSTCSVVITVIDDESPNISFTNEVSAMDTVRVMCDLSEAAPITDFAGLLNAGGQVTDNCMVDEPTFVLLGDVLIVGSDPTTYIRSYEIADAAGNLDTLDQIIIIDDIGLPTVTAPADITVSCSDDISDFALTGTASFNDNCSNSPVLSITDEASVLTCANDSLILRIFTVTDNDGNIAVDTQRISKIDTEAPVFDGLAGLSDTPPITVTDTISCDQDFLDPLMATAADACGVTTIIIDTLPILPNVCSGYQVTYRYAALDACMNADTMYSGFWVSKDTTAPVVTALDTFINLTTDLGACTALATLPLPTVEDNCSDYTIVNSLDGAGILTDAFELGETTFSYTISDDCGNMTVVDQTVIVSDDESPVVTCRTTPIQISVSSDMSMVLAQSFILSATDNCGAVDVQVRKLNDICSITGNEMLGDTVFFCCEDVGSIHEIEVVVTDESGNQNTCIALAEVSDKVNPSFLIPVPDITVSCDFPLDLEDLSQFGTFVNTDETRADIIVNDTAYVATDGLVGQDGVYKENCPGTTVTTQVVDMTTNGQGTIMRIFTITDASGNDATYTQRIFVQDFNPFSEDDITWPQDITVDGCESDIPTVAEGGVPTFTNINKCHEIQFSSTDLVFDNPTSGCVYVRRTFKVIDANIYDPNGDPDAGVWTQIQDIFMTNSVAPVFAEACSDTLICAQGSGCSALVELSVSATDDCTNIEDLTYEYVIDTNNDGVSDISGNGNAISEILPQGMHQVTFTVYDRCGNSTTCERIVEVKECKAPSVVCVALALDLSPIDGTIQIWANDFVTSSSDNCTDAEDLIFSFSADQTEFGRTFTCDSVGIREVEIWVTDEAGNQDFCVTTVDVQDNQGACNDGLDQNTTMMGLVATANNVPISNTAIVLEGPETYYGFITGEQGEYVFQDVPMYNDYTVTPSKNDEHLNGVSTLDLVLIQRHILAFDQLDSPYDIIAADINGSENVSAADVIELRKLILGVQEEFNSNNSFRFVEASYVFADSEDPFPFMEEKEFNEVDAPEIHSDFIAVKIGDVNGSMQDEFSSGPTVEVRSDNSIALYTEDQYLEAGETVLVPIHMNDIVSLAAIQYTLDYDSDYLEFISADGGQIELESSQVADHLAASKTTVAWSSVESVTNLTNKEALVYFAYNVKRNTKLSDVLTISSDITEAIAYDVDFTRYDIELRFDQAATPGFAMFQNQPNPFTEYTEIIFELPKAEDVTLNVFDNAGKLVHRQSSRYTAGKHQIRLNTDQLTESGVYYYKLKAGEYSEARKMLKIK